MGTKIANKFKDELSEFKTNITKTGKAIDATIEPNDTYFETRNTTTNTKNEKSAAKGFNPISSPIIVAIPLPPLKPV